MEWWVTIAEFKKVIGFYSFVQEQETDNHRKLENIEGDKE